MSDDSYLEGGRELVPETAPMRYHWFRDPRMSLAARGLLSFIVTHSPKYRLTVRQMIKETKTGKQAVYTALAELVELEYIARDQERTSGNRFGKTRYLYGPALFDQLYTRNWGKQDDHAHSDDSDDSDSVGGSMDKTAGQTASQDPGSGFPVSGSSASGKPDHKEVKDLEVKSSRDETPSPPSPPEDVSNGSTVVAEQGGEKDPEKIQEQALDVLEDLLSDLPKIRRPQGSAWSDVVDLVAAKLTEGWSVNNLPLALSGSFKGVGSVAGVLRHRIAKLGPPPPPKPRPAAVEYVPGRPEDDGESDRLLAAGRLDREAARAVAQAATEAAPTIRKGTRKGTRKTGRPGGESATVHGVVGEASESVSAGSASAPGR